MSESSDPSPRWFPDSMPLPAASRETLPWWQAAAQHRLVVQRCENCGRYRHPPSPLCPHCRNWVSSWGEHPGTGTIYTFTRVHQPFLPDLALPYVIAVIDLDGLEADHVRLVTNIVDADPDRGGHRPVRRGGLGGHGSRPGPPPRPPGSDHPDHGGARWQLNRR